MKFGVNLLLYSDTIDRPVLDRLGEIRDLGFDGVEVPIFQPDRLDAHAIRARAESLGLELTASGALPENADFCADAEARNLAESYLRSSLALCEELGVNVFCGPLYKPVGRFGGSVSLDEQRRRTAGALREIAGEAHRRGVTLALEPLNRFETDLVNTVEQGVALVADVAHPACGLLLDTFHMHIEEKDSPGAIARASTADMLVHVHASENDRGVAGSGQVPWSAVGGALRDAGYDGWVVLESFSQDNRAIRTAVSCWRPFYASQREFLEAGLRYVTELLDLRIA